jgi:hypothetical protein
VYCFLYENFVACREFCVAQLRRFPDHDARRKLREDPSGSLEGINEGQKQTLLCCEPSSTRTGKKWVMLMQPLLTYEI